jgi:hypothetical protein
MTLHEVKTPNPREQIATMLEAMAKDVRAASGEPVGLFVHLHFGEGMVARARHVVPGFNPLQGISAFEVDKAALLQQVLTGEVQVDGPGAPEPEGRA